MQRKNKLVLKKFKLLKKLFVILIALFITSCNKVDSGDNTIKIVAKAGEESLNIEQFKRDFVSTGNEKDSTYAAKKSIESWASESLFYQEAIKKIAEDELQIEEQVQNYRKSLVNYIYQTKLIEANLDTNVSKEEIEVYFNEHRDNFILKENIVKANYIKVPIKAPVLDKIRRLVWSVNPKDADELKKLCIQNAENFFINDSTWLFLDDIKKEIPQLKDQSDYSFYAGKVVEFTNEFYYYYLKVKEVKVKNALSPINFESRNIKKFIINNRKAQLINQYKQVILEKAKLNKTFVTY